MKRTVIFILIIVFAGSCRSGKETTVSQTKTDIGIDAEYKKRLAFLIDSIYTDRSKKTVDEKITWVHAGSTSDNSTTMDRYLRFDYPRDNSGEIIDSLKPYLRELYERTDEKNINTQTSEGLEKSLRTEIENNIRLEYQKKYDETVTALIKENLRISEKLRTQKKYYNPYQFFAFGFIGAILFYFLVKLILLLRKNNLLKLVNFKI